MSTVTTAFEIRDLPEILGAEILGLDLSQPPSDEDFARIRHALAQRQVVIFRDQESLTPEQQIAFSRRFGPLEIHVQHHFHLSGHPEILIVSNVVENGKPIGLVDAGKYWHSDLSYLALPSLGSLLHSKEWPAQGGDTLFVNMVAAYEALPDDVKAKVDGLQAEHSYLARNRKQQQVTGTYRPGLTAEQEARVPPVVHPVVRVHPESGKRALFVSEGFTTRIIGLPEDESDALLAFLFAHSTAERFQYRHRWRPHDMLFWDNRQTLHLATGCPPELRRTLYRTTVQGDAPRGIAA
ncbi:TauD/TfdA dioxygenase family protein [Elstera cyanobacteriorum]|uniref:Taurine dioxygenase n=1 Tax=Elstera cyanobacteriorum TaxID=2022747 RepID=A0A255XM38_9PROT|nr:TauD/TfdA family dioxygenase [Elstera cyanobacteriorum]MCK6443282.1 TauD/TfdA family dioxygenase [Elstera cyanobacteriorum]OYQ17464.1 taurine dioxygenase [Elstera cyanobacteriorum]GFZ94161.1 taurine dioxygenase [Elstera cyanobacteriorum]